MKPVSEQIRLTETFHPQAEHLASAIGNHGVDVVATTAIILFFETTSNNLVSPYFEQDDLTVGTHVNIDHLAPAYSNKPIIVTAVLGKVRGRKMEFDLTAKQGETIVMTGQHHRALSSRKKFSANFESASKHKKHIEFWFDFHSPWCYFASHRIGEIARQYNATLEWKPVHLANLSVAVDGRQPLQANRRFVDWYNQDQKDTAELLGLPFKPHKQYPKRPSRALRAAIYAADQELAEPFVKKNNVRLLVGTKRYF